MNNGIMAAALTASLAASTGVAHAAPPREPVRVAVVDVQPDRLDCKDANTTLINATPPLPPGMREAVARSGGTSHGVVVMTALVEEIRKNDRDVPIEVYAINPFIKDSASGESRFSKAMLREGLNSLQGKNVRIAVTTFAINDPVQGQKIADMFKERGMVLFASSPNEPNDPGIYPAASNDVISIAQDGGGRAISKDQRYREFTKFVFPGEYIGRSAQTTGASFATPRAAAYGALMVHRDPSYGREDIVRMFDGIGHETAGYPKGVKFVDGRRLMTAIDSIKPAAISRDSEGPAAQVAAVAETVAKPDQAVRQARMAAFASMSR